VRTPTRASRVDPVESAPRVRSNLLRAVAGIGALGSSRSVSEFKATASAMADEEHPERREEASEVSWFFLRRCADRDGGFQLVLVLVPFGCLP